MATKKEAEKAETCECRTKLHRLLYHMDFTRALRRIELKRTMKLGEGHVCEQCQRLMAEGVEVVREVEVVDHSGKLPLHIALDHMSRAPFNIVKALIEQYKEAVKIPTKVSTNLPLTLACSPKDRDWKGMDVLAGSDLEKTIILLMRKCPRAISKKSKEGGTPFHMLLEHKPQLPLVSEMIHLADGLIAKRDKSQGKQRLLDIKDCEGQLPLHIAIAYRAPTDVIMKIFTTKSDAVVVRMHHGYLPLHFAAKFGCAYPVLDRLLESNILAVKEKTANDYGGETPLHLVFADDAPEKWLGSKEDVSDNYLSPEQVVRKIVFHYYNSLRTKPIMTSSKNKKKRPVVYTEQQATRKIKELLVIKNSLGRSVYEEAKAVEPFFSVPEKLLTFLKMLTNEEFDLESERVHSAAKVISVSSSSTSDSSSDFSSGSLFDSDSNDKEIPSGCKRSRVSGSKERSNPKKVKQGKKAKLRK
mmetsp:Transcript_14207/g.18943  ORF Transcript_14207/g.18943 Transcript_14207/m.18943 type:complete len:471 (+) Transcript_14207:23-1435(+)